MTDQQVLFETEEYKVVPAQRALPIVLGDDAVHWVDGYRVVNKKTEQIDGEFRSLGDSMLYAVKWTQDIYTARQGAMQLAGMDGNTEGYN